MEPERHINNLPTEILCEVFDYLKFEQQMVATTVCKKWHTALSATYYFSRRLFCLTTCNLNGDSSLLQRIKQYSAFTLKDTFNDREFLEPLREFLFCQEVAGKVEQLCLDLYWYSFSELLGNNNVLYLPKLRKIKYLSSIWVEDDSLMRCKLVTPNLKTVILEDVNQSVNPFIHTVNDQIETLSVKFIDIELFCAALGNLPFTNLTSLTLTPNQGCPRFLETDFHKTHLQIFGRLKYLEIRDGRDVFYSIYRLIFREAKNLETLIINGRKMSEDAFNQLGQLKKLRKLDLMVHIPKTQPLVRLSLPLLEEMTTYANAIAPLGNAPNLRSISVMNNKYSWDPCRFTEDAISYGILTPYLLTLTLHDVMLDSLFVDHICMITGLRNLELTRVWMESEHLQKICITLKHLQCVRLEFCYINDFTIINSTTMDEKDEGNNGDENEEDCDKPDFIQRLQVLHPGLRIRNWQNRFQRIATCNEHKNGNLGFFYQNWLCAILGFAQIASVSCDSRECSVQVQWNT